jgi:recombination protein RecR
MLPDSITALIAALAKLPGIGPRSAERIALHLVQADSAVVKQLADTMLQAREKIRFCTTCGALTEKSPCSICDDRPRRDASLVCVVERAVDILSIEKSGTYRGKFHVLGGKISPLDGVEPEDLRIGALEKRLTQEPIKEIIMRWARTWKATRRAITWPNGWRAKGLKISRIAYGLPAGSGLEFADELTLSRALEGRREML